MMPMQNNSFRSFGGLWLILSNKRKFQAKLILLLMLIASVVEIFSIGLVMPFLTSLSNPEKVIIELEKYFPVLSLSTFSLEELRISLLAIFLFMTIISGFIRYTLLYSQIRYGHAVGADLCLSIFSNKLHLPYKFHANSNSSKLISDIKRSDDLVGQILFAFLFMLSSFAMMIFMVTFLLFISPKITIFSILFFSTIYFLILLLSRRKISSLGKVMNDNITKRMKVLQEGFGGVRDIIVDQSQKYFEESFSKTDLPYRSSAALIQVFSSAPRYVV